MIQGRNRSVLDFCEIIETPDEREFAEVGKSRLSKSEIKPAFKIGDRVLVESKGERVEGEVRYIKEENGEKPWGVFLLKSGSTHYYATSHLTRVSNDADPVGEFTGEIIDTPESTATPSENENTGEITPSYETSENTGEEAVPPPVKSFQPPATDMQTELAQNTVMYLGKKIRTKLNEEAVVQGMAGSKHLKVILVASGEKHQIHVSDVAEILPDQKAADAMNSIKIGDKVMTRIGMPGEVIGISGRNAFVKTINGTTSHYTETLRALTPEEIAKMEIPLPGPKVNNPAITGEYRDYLHLFSQIAQMTGNAKSIRTMEEISSLSMEDCAEMSKAQTLHGVFREYFREIAATLEAARLQFGNAFDEIEERLAVQND
jgi:preprotein translocase subunit YajC